MIVNVRLGGQRTNTAKIAGRTPETACSRSKYAYDQLVRLEIRDRRINEFCSRYQRNLHNPQGQKNNDAARTLTLRQRACLPSGPSDSILT
jgi:hypothetical protein